MVQVALYNDQQHEQYSWSTPSLALRETLAGSGHWTPVWDEIKQQAGGNLVVAVHGEAIAIEAAPNGWQLADGGAVHAGDILPMPCLLQIGTTWLEFASTDAPRLLVPLQQTSFDDLFELPTAGTTHAGPSTATVTKWLTDVGQLHRATAGSTEYYTDAARFAVETVGLDAAWVLRRHEDQVEAPWQIVGSYLPYPKRGICFDQAALKKLEDRPLAWYQPAVTGETHPTQAIVFAPVLDKHGDLIAAIYGVRDTRGLNRRRGVRPLEARLVQLLAESVAVGIARHQQEIEATRTRVLLEHAFSPTVAEYIQQHPESLSGQERDITLMFADLRGYTTLAETMPLTDCYDLLGEVMEALTQVVMRRRGVVVDYYGDGLLALWNAPLEQPNHADLACLAAVEMFEAMPPLVEKWQARLSGPLELGIGIHSGPAYVGNAGTRSRLKYGPRGNTVHIASRVQAASKQLQLPLVITAATQTKLSDKFFTLRVCTAKLPGLEQPAELFTCYPATEAARVKSRLDQYSQALALFEAGELDEAETLLSELTTRGQVTPAHFLAHYAAAQKSGNLGRRAVDKYASEQGPIIEIRSK